MGDNEELNPGQVEQAEVLKRVSSSNGALIHTATLTWQGFSVQFKRDINTTAFDELIVNFNPSAKNHLSLDARITIIQTLIKEFSATDPDLLAAGINAQATADVNARNHIIVERLNQTIADHLTRITKFSEDLQADYVKKLDELEKKRKNEQAEMEAWVSDRELELKKQEDVLSDRAKTLDDRNNTHVRRELRKSLHDDIKQRLDRFELSRPTRLLRYPVYIVASAAAVVLAALLWRQSEAVMSVMSNPPTNNSVLVMFLAQLGMKAIGLALLIWFFLRFLARWAEQNATSEMAARQLQLDVNRASWAVEAAFEWQQQKGEPMPPELLRSITYGLFGAERRDADDGQTAADQLASAILGSSMRLKLQAAGSEFEIDPKALRKKPAA